MSVESGPQSRQPVEASWRGGAEVASATLYPGLLEQLRDLRPEGDRAIIQEMVRAEGLPVAHDGDIAQLWLLSRFDERAHDEMSRMVDEGLCTPDDVAAVFFKMAEMGLF